MLAVWLNDVHLVLVIYQIVKLRLITAKYIYYCYHLYGTHIYNSIHISIVWQTDKQNVALLNHYSNKRICKQLLAMDLIF